MEDQSRKSNIYFQGFLKKLGLELPYDPVISLLRIHPEEARVKRDTSIPVFIAALFTIAKTWKQTICL